MWWLACTNPGAVREAPSDTTESVETDGVDTESPDSDDSPSRCPEGMADLGSVCMDAFEAPNRAGALPLVMYTKIEATAWCASREKRLCTDVEWTAACGDGYPYGAEREPGRCNDDETWRVYSQEQLNAWPASASSAEIDDLEALFSRATDLGAAVASDHVRDLYQGEGGGINAGCTSGNGVFDLVGNVEEWTDRADGGTTSFTGALKGRYWAESRTCQSTVTSHGDGFRFYEIGFRCCSTP